MCAKWAACQSCESVVAAEGYWWQRQIWTLQPVERSDAGCTRLLSPTCLRKACRRKTDGGKQHSESAREVCVVVVWASLCECVRSRGVSFPFGVYSNVMCHVSMLIGIKRHGQVASECLAAAHLKPDLNSTRLPGRLKSVCLSEFVSAAYMLSLAASSVLLAALGKGLKMNSFVSTARASGEVRFLRLISSCDLLLELEERSSCSKLASSWKGESTGGPERGDGLPLRDASSVSVVHIVV